MEGNDQINYELEVLKEELDRVSKIIEEYRRDSEERPIIDPNDPQNCENILNKMKTINKEVKAVKQKIVAMFEMVAVYPNFPKTQFSADEEGRKKFEEAFEKAFNLGRLLMIGTSSTTEDNIINEMVFSMDETYDSVSDNLRKLKEFKSLHNNLIDHILKNKRN